MTAGSTALQQLGADFACSGHGDNRLLLDLLHRREAELQCGGSR